MGLAIVVGALADVLPYDEEGAARVRRQLADANAALARRGLPGFTEPETLAERSRASSDGFPQSFLHHLRRAFAHLRRAPGEPISPVKAGGLEVDAAIVDLVTHRFDSHLLCHSDSEGLYVPVDFAKPLFCDPEERIGGGLLGSSQGLLREIVELGPALGVRLGARGVLDDAEAARINQLVESQLSPFWIELTVWLAIFEAARISVASSSAIVFE